jgi:putative transposase
MTRKRKRHSKGFKAKVALEAVKGLKTSSELASHYQVHPAQIRQRKKQLLPGFPDLFAYKSNRQKIVSEEELTSPLYEEIGRLKMELNWLKKKVISTHGIR